jgi:hypothetical protein
VTFALTIGRVGLTVIFGVLGLLVAAALTLNTLTQNFETGGGSSKGCLFTLLATAAVIALIWLIRVNL